MLGSMPKLKLSNNTNHMLLWRRWPLLTPDHPSREACRVADRNPSRPRNRRLGRHGRVKKTYNYSTVNVAPLWDVVS